MIARCGSRAASSGCPARTSRPTSCATAAGGTGPDLFVLVDDYDLVASRGNNPLQPLAELLPQARDIGLHLIITRRAGGASRALYDPVIQRMRELDSPGFLMSGNKDEGALLGDIRPSPQPPGRGTLMRRSDGIQLVQTAWTEPT